MSTVNCSEKRMLGASVYFSRPIIRIEHIRISFNLFGLLAFADIFINIIVHIYAYTWIVLDPGENAKH